MAIFLSEKQNLSLIEANEGVIKAAEYSALLDFDNTVQMAEASAKKIEEKAVRTAKTMELKAHQDGVESAKLLMAENLIKANQHIQESLDWVEAEMPTMLSDVIDELFIGLNTSEVLAALVKEKIAPYRHENRLTIYLPESQIEDVKASVQIYIDTYYHEIDCVLFEADPLMLNGECVIEGVGSISRSSVAEKIQLIQELIDKSFAAEN